MAHESENLGFFIDTGPSDPAVGEINRSHLIVGSILIAVFRTRILVRIKLALLDPDPE